MSALLLLTLRVLFTPLDIIIQFLCLIFGTKLTGIFLVLATVFSIWKFGQYCRMGHKKLKEEQQKQTQEIYDKSREMFVNAETCLITNWLKKD